MRLLLVVDSLDGGGGERHVVDLAVELRRRGRDPTVACSVEGVLAGELRAADVPVRPLAATLVKRRLDLRYARALATLVRRGEFDLVHAHMYASEAASALATAGTLVPLVVTEHTEGAWRRRSARFVSRRLYARAARVVAVSRPIGELLHAYYGVPRSRLVVVPPGVTPMAPSETTGRPQSGGVRGPTIGHVARLQPEKGVDVFIRAAAALAVRFPGAEFLVVGEGPLRSELETLALRLGLGRRISFLGYRRDARRLIGELDVLAVASLADGAPLAVLEAMEAGIPVVASAIGGIPEQIRDRQDGLLVPPGDPDALADALAALLDDPARARRLAASGRERAAHFSHRRLVDRLEQIYAEALVERRDTRAAATSRRLGAEAGLAPTRW